MMLVLLGDAMYHKAPSVGIMILCVQADGSSLLADINHPYILAPLLSELRIGRDTCCVIDALPGSPFHYVLEGEVLLRRAGETRALRQGDFLLLPHWISYEIRNGDATERLSLKQETERMGLMKWSADFGRPLKVAVGPQPHTARLLSGIAIFNATSLPALGHALPGLILLPDAASRMKRWTEAAMELIDEGEQPSPGFNAIASRAVEMLVSVALRDWAAFSEHETGWLRAVRDPRLAQVLDAIHSEPGRRWTLAQLAERAGMSPSAFAGSFLQMLGETPFDYLRRWRMHVAAQRLSPSHRLSVTQVAADLGYRSTLSFSRAFRQATGLAPAAFRRQAEEGAATSHG